jgi:hypothetical protein
MTTRRWWVEGFGGGFWLSARSGWGLGEDVAAHTQALGPQDAARRVDEWFPEGWGDPGETPTLMDIASALGEEPGWSADGPAIARLKTVVRDALRDGRLVALWTNLQGSGGGEAAEEEEARPAERAPQEEKTWIEIVLINDEDPPLPVPFKKYRIELASGETREGMLDANGRARIVGIDPGKCQVTFPGLDKADWKKQ